MSVIADPPSQDSLIETDPTTPGRQEPFYVSASWLRWLTQSLLAQIANVAEIRLAPTDAGGTLDDQHAAIAATPLAAGQLSAGTYRLTYYARIKTPDGVASSLTVSLGWTEDTLALSQTGAAMTGDTVSTVQNGSIMVTIDRNSSPTYSTAYASNTPAKMGYKLSFLLEGPFA